MTTLLCICVGSLLGICGLYVFKYWEHKRGHDSFLTHLLQRWSPPVEAWYRRVVARVSYAGHTVRTFVMGFAHFVAMKATMLARAVVTVIGAHMIHVARGEKLVAEGKIPSKYFSLLHRHKKSLKETDVPSALTRSAIPKRVRVQAVEEPVYGDGEIASTQVE